MTDKIELKPCPFCGGEAEIIDDAMGTISRCRCCGAENGNGVYGKEGHKLAVKDWNARPIEDELRKELRRFKKYSAALEEEIKGLHKQLAEAREDANDNMEYHVAERKRLKAALDLILKIANAYPHDGSACAHIAERALSGEDAVEEWERLGKEIDAEAEKANVIGIWEFKR